MHQDVFSLESYGCLTQLPPPHASRADKKMLVMNGGSFHDEC